MENGRILEDIAPVLVHAGGWIAGIFTVSCAGLTAITMCVLQECHLLAAKMSKMMEYTEILKQILPKPKQERSANISWQVSFQGLKNCCLWECKELFTKVRAYRWVRRDTTVCTASYWVFFVRIGRGNLAYETSLSLCVFMDDGYDVLSG